MDIRIHKPYLTIIYSILLLTVVCTTSSATPVAELWKKYTVETIQEKKITLLINIADEYTKEKNTENADSVFEMAIVSSQLAGNDTLLASTYIKYFQKEDFTNYEKATEYANNYTSMAVRNGNNDWACEAYASSAKVALDANDINVALEKINKAYYYAGLNNNDTLKINCCLIWAKCLQTTNNKLDAFRKYMDAQYLAQKCKNNKLLLKCYGELSYFYLLIGNYERSRDCTIKRIGLLHEQGKPIDSAEYIDILGQLAERYYYNKERKNAEKINNQLIDYARRHHDDNKLKEAFDYTKTFLSQNGLFKELAFFYTHEHPEELIKLAKDDTVAYYRVMAYIQEEKGNIDSSRYYFEDAEKMILRTKGHLKIYVSNFMKRYAQFLLRTGNTLLAKAKMETSYQYAKNADYLPYLIETSHYLDSLNYAAGNTKDAYTYAKLNKEYSDRQEAATKQDALLLMEIDNEAKQRELIAKQEQEETERRYNVQYFAITITILSIFILLIMFGVFKVSKLVIRSVGFFAFIIFFEFVILLADHKIMEITHHEPWKMLGIKIIIISLLLPFHHWIEHRVTHYLIEHHLVDAAWIEGKKFWKRKKTVPMDNELPNDSEL